MFIWNNISQLDGNMDIGSLALFNIYVQDDKHLSAAQAGLITFHICCVVC